MQKSLLIAAGIMLVCMAAVFAGGCISKGETQGTPVNTTAPPQESSMYFFNQTDNNQNRQVELDAEISLMLQGNPTTGYTWQLTTTPGIVIENESYVPDDQSGAKVGSGGTFVWRMKAARPGNQVISAVYTRPWESNTTGAETFTLTLGVGEVLTPPGSPPGSHVYTDVDNGRQVNESPGNEFNIRLMENPTTGYQWNMTASNGLKMVGDTYIPSNPTGQIAGAGGIRSITYKAEQPGNQTVHGEYRRVWVPAGTVAFIDLEGGFYGILGDDGNRYDPVQLDDQYRKDGLRVAYEYVPVKDGASIHMWGEQVNLTFIEEIPVYNLSVQVV